MVKNFKKRITNVMKLSATKKYIYQYPKYYKKLKIKKNVVLIESTHGRNLSGHLFYIGRELAQNFKHLQLYVVAQNIDEMYHFLKANDLSNIEVVKHLSTKYCKLLASAEYLLNDTSFYPFFTKKNGQKYINTWHGTPLKTLGKDQEQLTDMSNVQRNFYMADQIIVSNEYTQKIIAESHCLDKIYQGKMVVAPSPRNSIMLNDLIRNKIRDNLALKDNKVYFYMPTWRGIVGNVSNDQDKIIFDLNMISASLKNNERFFVKLHPFQADIDLKKWSNIEPMPSNFEVYEFLTAVDVLITDYSSIMYDFSLTNREIILYIYDKQEYFSTRGVYDNIERYPFTKVENISDLILKMQSSVIDVNYDTIHQEFCPVDCVEGVSIFCEYVFNNHKTEHIQEVDLHNGKETAVILSGGFWDNGITTALLNTFDNIDLQKRNYVVFFEKGQLKKEHEFRVRNLDPNISYYPVTGMMNGTLIERMIYRQYMRSENFNYKWVQKIVKRLFVEEVNRIFGDLKIDHFIHYTGFERKYAEMLKHFPKETNTVIYYHTDMFMEYESKKNLNQPSFNKKIIFSAYEKASKVALVHQNLKIELVKNFPHIENSIYVANNFLGEKRIKELSTENLFSTLSAVGVDYAAEVDEISSVGIFSNLLSVKEEFLNSNKLFEEYKKFSLSSDLQDIKLYNKDIYAKIVNKFNLIETLFMTESLGIYKAQLVDDLINDHVKVFINIGRYAYQKGHDRLIAAFEKVYLENNNCRLVIVAPHGPLKRETINWVKESKARDAIYILGRMSNPYPLLKYCDAFVLSSYYEGLGLVVYEALAVGTTPITVNLKETIEYLNGDEAIIVESSQGGLYQGMKQYLETGNLEHQFDFLSATKRSLEEFEAIFIK